METTQEEREQLRSTLSAIKTGQAFGNVTPWKQIERLLNDADHLADMERQALWRTEDMPEWGGLWVKDEMRRCYWWGVFCHTFCAAPDYRPDEEGPLFLPILDPPEGD